MKCRFCKHELNEEFVDLASSPPSNSFLTKEQLSEMEPYFPLLIYVCNNCWLVQIDEHKNAQEIFSEDYLYFSSYSKSWFEHAKKYVCLMEERLKLDDSSLVVEIASNDGYLLQYVKELSIQCLGIEPTLGTAKVAIEKGIPTINEFFGEKLAHKLANQGKKADLLLGNNVLAHVPDLNDFVKGLNILLKEDGVVTMEFPHLMKLVEEIQFDTIYHEHFSYLSLSTVQKVFKAQGLRLFDVEKLPTHGGSLRIFATHEMNERWINTEALNHLLQKESDEGMLQSNYYKSFQPKVNLVKNELLEFLIKEKKECKRVVAYGAAAKGNTFLNYAGIKSDLIEFVVDASPYKQGKYLPGSHIPVVHEKQIRKHKPNYVLILPWNITNEIMNQLSYIREWSGKFVVAIPKLNIF